MADNHEFDLDALMKKMNSGGFQEKDYTKYDPAREARKSKDKESRDGKKGRENGRSHGGGERQAGNARKRSYSEGYVGAPYNFVPFWKEPQLLRTEPVSHAMLQEELFSGEIRYRVTAHTPINIGSGNEDGSFYRTPYGKYAIPGSTMRGLIRSNVRILGMCLCADDIDDYALMYRAVATADTKLRNRYKDILGAKIMTDGDNQYSVLLNVKAGYLKKVGDSYRIYLTKTGPVDEEHYGYMNYYIVSERRVIESYVKSLKGGSYSYDFFLPKNGKKMQNLVREGKDADHQFEKIINKIGKAEYLGKENPAYKPYYADVSFETGNTGRVTAVGDAGRYSKKGVLISTGIMRGKKAVYIIPEIDEEHYKELNEKGDDIRNFRIDYERKKNGLKDKDFYNLPGDGEVKPVFYVEIGERVYFGFTPRLRIFYDKTVKECLPEGGRRTGTDYVQRMFGYTGKKSSYKSRLSFSDLELEGEAEAESVMVILQNPKPSSYADYLATDENGDAYTYNDRNAELRGIKQYWLHEKNEEQAIDANKQKSLIANMKILPAGSVFQGVIRYHNLSAEELGLLLWSIRLEENSMMNVGHAKPLGYGRIKTEISEVKQWDATKAYDLTALSLSPWSDNAIDTKELIQKYKDAMKEHLKTDDIFKCEPIKTFFLMKDAAKMQKPQNIRYMNIDQKEYRNRRPLPTADEVAKQ